ncbi:pre-mRNA-splicing factor RBM22-like [Hylaeus volcanicus]|uniref:pre-mRNA-splicing factor RBM22-like n=1 Tax=Hylaeus volcanicus TaxID=313075 RepID=UPI0023B871CE|nr:pre-mRNA-splicing factor RBM22-like [Hylaeus volcanicus]
MAHRELTVETGVTSRGWETSTFPLVCETCLGDNPYIRMIRLTTGKECRICTRPYTSFRWQPGGKARYKNTIICQTCAKVKNVCQVCLFDLEFGLPVEVRDKFLDESQKLELPTSQLNRDYAMNKLDTTTTPYNNSDIHPMLLQLARHQPYYKRNESRVCTFWVRGECKRGEECPYRHEVDTHHDPNLADQNTKNRYMGKDDPVAHKILSQINPNQTS